MNFAHLHNHTEFSILDGYSKIPSIIKRLKDIGQDSVAITDHGSLSGAHKFYKLCKEKNIKPIIGYEGYFCRDISQKNVENKKLAHLLLLATNKTGFKNLIHIASQAATYGFYYKPRIDLALIEKYKEGLICTTACLASYFNQLVLSGNIEKAKEHLHDLQNIFDDKLYIELQNHELEEQQVLLRINQQIAQELSLPLVATNDCHYTEPEDAHYQDIIFCDQLRTSLDDEKRLKLNEHFYIKTAEEMYQAIPVKEAIENTIKIAEQCDINLTKSKYVMPKFDKEELLFDQLIKQGIEDRFELLPNEEYKERLKFEIKVIKEASLIGYFLTVSDYIIWAKNNEIMVGPGRGSVAGSLVAYLLHIHDVDPIKYNLLFSRFYNPGRKKSLPDVDTDFAESDVNKVIDYLVSKYGRECVASIGTFQKVAGKGAIKLVCRVNKVAFDLANKYSALVDSKKHKTLDDAFKSRTFLDTYTNDDTFKEIVEEARKIEDTIVSQGVHAAGIVVSNSPIAEIVPIRKDKNTDLQVTAWDMEDVEEAGLIKFDFLSLSTLDVIRDCMKLSNLDYHYTKIPLDDPAAYNLISTTTNVGVFQLSSTGISSLANQMQVQSIYDISIVVALYRPGPLESGLDKLYLDRKFERKPVEYTHQSLEPSLKDTLGVLIFQEQITKICMSLAKFTEEEADELRKIIGKKLIEKEGGKEKLNKIANSFVKKCKENGISEIIAQTIWDQINKFASYCFNLSHAVSYSLLTYYTAYLKAHYPVEFMTALLNTAIGKPDKLKAYLSECKKLDIEIVPPRYHHDSKFTCSDKKIYFALSGIMGLGASSYEKIQGKQFSSFQAFCLSVKPETDMLIALIEAGALDNMGYSRRALLEAAPSILEKVRGHSKKKNPSQKSLFKTEFSFDIPKLAEFSEQELAAQELFRLGTYLRINPLEQYRDFAKDHTMIPDISDIPYDYTGRILCCPISIKIFLTRTSNKEMAKCTCETLGDPVELLIFPRAFSQFKSRLKQGVPILVSGSVIFGESFSFAADHIDTMNG
jgi:DNA polymerase-3 subunit alpha